MKADTDNKKDYAVSVITPFHNVDEGMFRNCVKSMENQTIGFENVEWIVVLHNCNEESVKMAKSYLDKYDNVKLPILNNDAHTPSSPRNYGVTLATAPYIGYLDGDDSYMTDCLEIAVREIHDTQSQVLTFRRDYELEKETLRAVAETVLWNQTEWRVVMDKNHWQEDKMFAGIWGFVTSRMFDRKFLIENEIAFNEDITWGEDFMYTANCLLKADRICYLPQFIGYHYFVNSGSLVQNMKKKPEELLSFFKGVNSMLDFMDSYGIDYNEVAQRLYKYLSFYVLNSDLSVADRQKLKEISMPYIMKFYKIAENKLWSYADVEMVYRLPREVILSTGNPEESPYLRELKNGWHNLTNILTDNNTTDFGCAHHFDKVKTLSAYTFRVPRSKYDDIKRMIELQTNIGEKNILTNEKISSYFLNNKGQLIPNTESHFTTYMECFATTLAGHHNILISASLPIERVTNDKAMVDTMDSMMTKSYFARYLNARGKRRANFSAPDISFFKNDLGKGCKAIARYALADREVDQIVSLTTMNVVKFFECIKANWKDLVAKIRKTDMERADEVEAILSQGFDKPIAKALWPKLKRIVAFGAGELYESTKRMKDFTGNVPHNHGYYYTEECVYGKAIGDDTDVFEFFDSGCFFEAMPLNTDKADSIFYDEMRVGTPYALIVTNKAGLYRFETDHIICPKVIEPRKYQFTIY